MPLPAQALAEPKLQRPARTLIQRVAADPAKPARITEASIGLFIAVIIAAFNAFRECKAKGEKPKAVAKRAKRLVFGIPLRLKLQSAVAEVRDRRLAEVSLTELDPYWSSDSSPKHLTKHVIDYVIEAPESELAETQRTAELYLPAPEV
jgi:hypothetical protein